LEKKRRKTNNNNSRRQRKQTKKLAFSIISLSLLNNGEIIDYPILPIVYPPSKGMNNSKMMQMSSN